MQITQTTGTIRKQRLAVTAYRGWHINAKCCTHSSPPPRS